jgi:ATP-dependent Zn protease
MPSDYRVGTAYHEAGHAVVAWALGLPVAEVAIGKDGDDSAGRTAIEGTDAHLPVFDRIVVYLAGLEAQEVFEAPIHEKVGWGDFGKIVELLDDVSEDESLKTRTAARQRAREIILANRAKVASLAQRLLADERVDGAAFLTIVSAYG